MNDKHVFVLLLIVDTLQQESVKPQPFGARINVNKNIYLLTVSTSEKSLSSYVFLPEQNVYYSNLIIQFKLLLSPKAFTSLVRLFISEKCWFSPMNSENNEALQLSQISASLS